MHEHRVVPTTDSLVRTHALLAVALSEVRHVVVLGDELAGPVVVANHDNIAADHLSLALPTRQPERHVLVLLDTSRDPNLHILAYQLPLYLNTALQQLLAVAHLLRRGCAARLRAREKETVTRATSPDRTIDRVTYWIVPPWRLVPVNKKNRERCYYKRGPDLD